MLRKRVLLSISVAFLLVTTGCVGFSAPDRQSPSATATDQAHSSEQCAATTNSTSSACATNLDDQREITGIDRPDSYAALYDRAIDSVVKIVVRTPRGRSQGSGFVYRGDGYIVTNQHVVGRADSVQVRFYDGTWKTGSVVGTDVYTDLAVVHVEQLPAGVDALPMATREPEPGQRVVALGSPYGYEGTITHGIVSGVNRSMMTERGFAIPDTIQTDAPINPGNSGGPLVSLNGTVLGVNRAKRGDNLGFAISADVVRRVVPALIANGTYHHSFMGIKTIPVTPRIAAANDLETARGTMVTAVIEGGPSAGVFRTAEIVRTDAGVRLPVGGDVIVSVDGHPIRSQQDLSQYLMLHTRPGEQIDVTVLRDGDRVTVSVTLGQRPELETGESV